MNRRKLFLIVGVLISILFIIGCISEKESNEINSELKISIWTNYATIDEISYSEKTGVVDVKISKDYYTDPQELKDSFCKASIDIVKTLTTKYSDRVSGIQIMGWADINKDGIKENVFIAGIDIENAKKINWEDVSDCKLLKPWWSLKLE